MQDNSWKKRVLTLIASQVSKPNSSVVEKDGETLERLQKASQQENRQISDLLDDLEEVEETLKPDKNSPKL